MTLIETSVKTFLAADSTLVGLIAAANIVTFDETKRNGIGILSTPTLFTDGVLEPVLMIREETEGWFGGIRDSGAKVRSTGTRICCYFLVDGDVGYTNLETARDRVVALLADQIINTVGGFKWAGNLKPPRDSSLDNAAQLRTDFQVARLRG